MNRLVLLLDTQHARIYRLGSDAPVEKLRLAHPDHHTHRETHEDRESPQFYARVATHLHDADEILVVGHGLAKVHFRTFLEHRAPEVAKRVIGYETVDHPTEGQLHALAVQYFHRVEAVRAARGE